MSNEQNKPRFTPGPWSTGRKTIHITGHGESELRLHVNSGTFRNVCELPVDRMGMPQQEQEANAHLIAAAPDLYETLYSIFLTAPYGLSVEKMLQDISDVLAKARGENSC